jgi:hypothetical protein
MNYWEGKMSKGKVFTAQEVQAIIAGNKTQFRAICKRQPQGEIEKPYIARQPGITEFNYPFGKIPYKVGQKIFVKESFSTDEIFSESCVSDISYEANWEKDNAKGFFGFFDEPKWKPAQHMKQEHSRLTLQIKEIRVERLQDISEEDAVAEAPQYSIIQPFGNKCPIDFFKTLWNSTHKKPEEKFEASPWVWSIQFEVENE